MIIPARWKVLKSWEEGERGWVFTWPLLFPGGGGRGVIYVVAERSPLFCRLLLIFPEYHKTWLPFTQLQCVSGRGFLIRRNTAAQPSLFPWIGVSGCFSLPFTLLTVMNVLFSWNGQNLDPQMGPKWPWWHCRDSFRGKNSHLSEQGLQNIWHKDMIVSCIRNINAPYLWFGGMKKEETNLTCGECITLRFSLFFLHVVPQLGAQERQVTSEVNVCKG